MKDNINITREEISQDLRNLLMLKYIDKFYENRKIVDIRVSVEEKEYNYDWGGGHYDELRVEIQTETPKGRSKRWNKVYF